MTAPPRTIGEHRRERIAGALFGMYIGDALAMPVHWYYDRAALARDYGRVSDYLTPRHPHADSQMGEFGAAPAATGIDIFHDQARYWGRPGVHYHRQLQAGENTLNVRLVGLLIDSLARHGAYRPEDYIQRLEAFMTTPGTHNDTYIDSYLRAFFARRAAGRPLSDCGVEEKHLSGLIGMLPLALYYRHDWPRARQTALTHMRLTHKGPVMEEAADVFLRLVGILLESVPLGAAIDALCRTSRSDLLAHPFTDWLPLSDETVVDTKLGAGCFIPEAFPVVIYLARKYHDRPAEALVANTNLGGNNAARGAILGALLGLAHGLEAFPGSWVRKLRHPPRELPLRQQAHPGD